MTRYYGIQQFGLFSAVVLALSACGSAGTESEAPSKTLAPVATVDISNESSVEGQLGSGVDASLVTNAVNEPDQPTAMQSLPSSATTSITTDTVNSTPVPAPTLQAALPANNDAVFCSSMVEGADTVSVPLLDKPSYLAAYEDPAFGSTVLRISNSQFGEVNKPAYSTMQAWSADERYLLLYRTGSANAGHVLLDGHSYEFIRELDFTPSDIEDVYWSRRDGNTLYYISKRSTDYGHMNALNVSTGQSEFIAEFSSVCGSGLPSGGNDVQMQSVDDDVFGFSCQHDNGNTYMLTYRVSADETVAVQTGDGTNWSSWSAPSVGASGVQFLQQGYVLQPDLNTEVTSLDIANPLEHSSMGMTHDGQDAFYTTAFNASPLGCNDDADAGIGHLVEYQLDSGECRTLIGEADGFPYTTSSTHVSATAFRRPEYVAVSSVGRADQMPMLDGNQPVPALLSEVYMANTGPGSPEVCRLAHHRSFGKAAKNGGYAPYFGEPHATISPTGTRILFGSDWYDSGSVDSYVIELPGYLPP